MNSNQRSNEMIMNRHDSANSLGQYLVATKPNASPDVKVDGQATILSQVVARASQFHPNPKSPVRASMV